MHCKSYSHFFSKQFQHICVPLDVNFNESLTNDIVSFEHWALMFTRMAGYYDTPSGVYPSSVHTFFLDNSPYSFHRIVLKLYGQLDNEVVQHILFGGYITPNFDRGFMLFNDFMDLDFVSIYLFLQFSLFCIETWSTASPWGGTMLIFSKLHCTKFWLLLRFLTILQTLTLFPDISSNSFHLIGLKHGGQLDYEVIQSKLFRGYSTPNFI